MPLLDITDPGIAKFLVEMYEKERHLRMRWLQINSMKIQKCATFKSDTKNYTEADITKATLVAGMATIRRDHIESMRHRLRAPVPEYLNAKTDLTLPEPIMKHVKDNVKSILLENRKQYLKTRGKKAPEEKYNSVESNNWKYGWKLNESDLKINKSAYGKICHTIHSLETRVGPQPDPPHYRSPYTHSHPCFQ